MKTIIAGTRKIEGLEGYQQVLTAVRESDLKSRKAFRAGRTARTNARNSVRNGTKAAGGAFRRRGKKRAKCRVQTQHTEGGNCER